MSDNQGKTSNFLNAINKYAEEQRNKIQIETESFKKQEMQKAETEILNRAYQMIQSEMAQMKNSIASELSRKEMQGKKELFEKRKEITNSVFEKATQKLIKFTQTDEYINLLKKYTKAISSVLTQPGTVLYLKKEDLCHAEVIKDIFGKDNCEVQVSNNIIIGGIRGCNVSMGIVADESLDAKLMEQKNWFAENSGLKLM